MKHYVYLVENTANGMKYIGVRSHPNPEEDDYLGSGIGVVNAIKEFGRAAFTKTVICCLPTRKAAEDTETKFLLALNAAEREDFYNLVNATFGGPKTKEHRKKISNTMTGVKKSRIHRLHMRKPKSEEHKRKISQSRKGQRLTEETKAKLSEAQKKIWAKRKGER